MRKSMTKLLFNIFEEYKVTRI